MNTKKLTVALLVLFCSFLMSQSVLADHDFIPRYVDDCGFIPIGLPEDSPCSWPSKAL